MELWLTDQNILKKIPEQPGVYRFYAATQTNEVGEAVSELLYVGKAINLHKRVKSYFQRSHELSPRIGLMVSKIARIELTVTENEVSALILENNLIKSLKPKYNIIFRDDKSYPLIRISKHQFPKLDNYRGVTDSANYFFGPYPNANAVKQSMDMIQRLFRLRTCNDSFFNSRSRPCMLYEVKRCSGPCVNLVSQEEYNHQVQLAVDFLEGRYLQIISDLTAAMFRAADNMEFELAAALRDKIALLKQISASQIINNHNEPISSDVLMLETVEDKVFIYLIILRNGIYVGDNHFVLANTDNEPQQVLEVFLESYYLAGRNTKIIHTSLVISPEFKKMFNAALGIKIIAKFTPQIERLYQMGQMNLRKIIDSYQGGLDLINAAGILAQKLGLPGIRRIECIDTSHNQGESAVASLVVYEDGVIDHSKYRKYNLAKEVQGNDLLALEIVLKRRLANKEMLFPEVLLVDGGATQLKAAKNILIAHKLYGKIRVIAIFKGERRDPMLDKVLLDNGLVVAAAEDKVLFKLLQGLRDEAHRFAITGHRKKQIKKMTMSKLMEIPNIGTKKRRALIAHFGSIKEVANASIEELCKVTGIGEALANQIYSYFH